MEKFENKVAFITGGASGIGLGMAKVFLRNRMKVVVADVLQERLDEAGAELAGFGANAHLLRVDVMDRRAMARAADESERVFGKVHILCNNAGVSGSAPIDVATYDDWDWVLGVNLGGVINGVVSFLPKLKAHGEGGHIVNTSSMAGLLPLPGAGGLYATSKFAVRGLTDSLRMRLGRFNIGVSVLCPGLTRSNIMESEKVRPAHLATNAAPRERRDPTAPSSMTGGMDPVELGERVLRGIERNDAYILTHGEFRDEVRGVFEDILAAFPTDQEPDAARLAFEEARRRATAAAQAEARGIKG